MSTDQRGNVAGAPAGFSMFFRDLSEVPNPPTDRLVELKKLTVVLHCSRALDENVGAVISSGDLAEIKRKAEAAFADMAPVVSDAFVLDDGIYYDRGKRFVRLTFGPIDVDGVIERPIDPKKKAHLTGTAYLVATIHDVRVVTVSLVLPIRPEGEFSIRPDTVMTADDMQRLIDVCFYDLSGFKFNGEPHKLREFLCDLLARLVSALGYPPRLDYVQPSTHISIYIWETAPDFDERAFEFAQSHAYEFLAMLGEELDWRDKSKDTVMKFLLYGKSLSRDDLVIPGHVASVVIDRSPDFLEFFRKFSVNRYAFLDSHVLAAHAAFSAFRQTVDTVISECTQTEKVDYPAAMEKLNALYLRYLTLRTRMYDVDHYWKDVAFTQYINCKEEFSHQLNSRAMSTLERTIERSREMATRIAEIAADRREAATNRALQVIGFLLSSTVVFTITEVSSRTFAWPPHVKFWIDMIWVCIISVLAVVFFLKR